MDENYQPNNDVNYVDNKTNNSTDNLKTISIIPNDENLLHNFPLKHLPEELLLRIFQFLRTDERLRVSSVCKNWRQLIFTSPRLWRRRQFVLRCNRHSKHSRNACFYARNLGKYLHKIIVTCEHPNNHSCRSMAICFRKLLASLKTPLTLTSFKVTDLRLKHTRTPVVDNISKTLEKLLKSMKRLKTFQMSDAHWPAEEGLRVINTILNGSSDGSNLLKTLQIDGFFLPRFVPSNATDVLTKGLGNLNSLTKLSIDYFYLSEESVLALAATRQGQLRFLKLVACDVSPHSTFVPKYAWLTLTSACPNLRVEFCVQGFTVSPARSIPMLLSPALRVNKVKLAIGAQYTFLEMPRLNMASVLGHITKHFRRRLIRFEMDIDNHNDALDAALVRLVRKCRNLISVKVTAYFNNADTDTLVRDLVRARRDKQVAVSSDKERNGARSSEEQGHSLLENRPTTNSGLVASASGMYYRENMNSAGSAGLGLDHVGDAAGQQIPDVL